MVSTIFEFFLGPPTYCSENNPFCQQNFWCHIGARRNSTLCCPNARPQPEYCFLPLNQGQGSDILPRFYFNQQTQQCVAFTYRGIKGNQNNFLTKEDCESICPVFSNPCATGPPLTDPSGRPQRCNRYLFIHVFFLVQIYLFYIFYHLYTLLLYVFL